MELEYFNMNAPYTNFSSGGGFSNYFPLADYQQSAVGHYSANHEPGLPYYTYNGSVAENGTIGAEGGLYNRAGRVSRAFWPHPARTTLTSLR